MIEFRAKDKDLFVSIFLNDGDKNIVIAPGLPQTITKHHPVVEQAKLLGANLFIPAYPGTHDSDGVLTIATATESLERTIKMVKAGSTVSLYDGKKISWKTGNIYVIGFSFGALPALLQNEKISKTVLLCPFALMEFHQDDTILSSEKLSDTLNFLRNAYPKTYRFNTEELVNEISNIQLPDSKDDLVIVSRKDDSSIPVQEVIALKEQYRCESHELSGKHSLSIGDDLFNQIIQ